VAKRTKSWLQLPAQPRKVFAQTPLALAVCQIRFPAMASVASPGTVAAFQAGIEADYPIATPVTQVSFSVSLQSGPLAGLQGQLPAVVWRFADPGDDWTVVLATDFLGLETRAYTSFPDFATRLERILETLVEAVRPKYYTRIGLRYINEIRPGHQEWVDVVRPELLGPMAVPELAKRHLRWSQQIVLEDGSAGEKLHIQQGVIPSGTTVERRPGEEDPTEEPFYLLDIDAYREFSRPLPTMSTKAISDQVRDAHETISEFFRWAITPSYAASLGARDDAGS
jgi:uncharacterized protein (TIGR04255 family)